MKKRTLRAAAAVLVFALLAGGNVYATGGQEKAAAPSTGGGIPKPNGYPTKTITAIVPGSAGGAGDIGWRAIQPFLEKEMGVSLALDNLAGGNGWVAWSTLANANPDGYTVGGIHVPAFPAGYTNPDIATGIDLRNFTCLGTNVNDMGVIGVRSDDNRFKDFAGFVDVARKNELTAGTAGNGSDDHIAALKVNDICKTKLVPVFLKSTPENVAALLGGHIDVIFFNVSEAISIGNEIKVLGIMGEERSTYLPDIPTLKEQGFAVYNGSSRGICGPVGMKPEIVQYWEVVLAKIMKDPAYLEKMKTVGIEVYYTDGEGFKKVIQTEEENIKKMMHLFKE
jgi:tripartite-type tricarboxylate transporter receptor subunit TctC